MIPFRFGRLHLSEKDRRLVAVTAYYIASLSPGILEEFVRRTDQSGPPGTSVATSKPRCDSINYVTCKQPSRILPYQVKILEAKGTCAEGGRDEYMNFIKEAFEVTTSGKEPPEVQPGTHSLLKHKQMPLGKCSQVVNTTSNFSLEYFESTRKEGIKYSDSDNGTLQHRDTQGTSEYNFCCEGTQVEGAIHSTPEIDEFIDQNLRSVHLWSFPWMFYSQQLKDIKDEVASYTLRDSFRAT